MILEVIATSVADAQAAAANGADRIELISAMSEGGLTPEYSLIKEVIRSVHIPVNVMVRPHSRSFFYNQHEVQTMIHDIEVIREFGPNGVVFGMLNNERKIDEKTLQVLLSATGDLEVTFHRAFDEAANQEESLETLLQYPEVTRILTSGGQRTVLHAVKQIKRLVGLTRDTHLSIMAGSGLTIEALQEFTKQTLVHEVHFGSGVRYQNDPSRGIDPEKIRAIKKIQESNEGRMDFKNGGDRQCGTQNFNQ